MYRFVSRPGMTYLHFHHIRIGFLRIQKSRKIVVRCFTWIAFIELNFTVAFLLIGKTCDGQVGGWGILRNGGILVAGMILKWGVDTPLRTTVNF